MRGIRMSIGCLLFGTCCGACGADPTTEGANDFATVEQVSQPLNLSGDFQIQLVEVTYDSSGRVLKGNTGQTPGSAAESPTLLTYSSWANAPSAQSITGIRLGLTPQQGNGTLFHYMDFRFGFQGATGSHDVQSSVYWTPWASDIGPTCAKGQLCQGSGQASGSANTPPDNEYYVYINTNSYQNTIAANSTRVALQIRVWPKPNRDLVDVVLAVRAWGYVPGCSSFFSPPDCFAPGDWQTTPWLSGNGGGFTHTAAAPYDSSGYPAYMMEPGIVVTYRDN